MCHCNQNGKTVKSVEVISESSNMVLTKELNDWILDEELINPVTLLVATDGNLGKQLLASREKERGQIGRAHV